MAKEKIAIGSEGVFDARKLGIGKMLVLGFQHMFAMFGATVLVPILTGPSVSTTLLMAGLGTLLFHVFTKFRVPAFLGSSFAFLGGYATVAPMLEDGTPNSEMLPYACLGVACAGLLYLVLAALIKIVGINKVMRFFPPVVTGPIIIAIGLGLAPSAISNCATNWWLAVIALGLVIILNVFGKGMVKIIPILLGIFGSYAIAAIVGNACGVEAFAIDFTAVKEADWFGLPIEWSSTVFDGVRDSSKAVSAIIAIMPYCPCHNDGAYRRYVRHWRYLRQKLYCRPRPAPFPHRRRSCDNAFFAVRRTGKYNIRREYRRACVFKDL